MGVTDSQNMPGRFAGVDTPVLQQLREDAEKTQVSTAFASEGYEHLVGFSTALTDEDRTYLDLCAELYARGEYGRQPCSETPEMY